MLARSRRHFQATQSSAALQKHSSVVNITLALAIVGTTLVTPIFGSEGFYLECYQELFELYFFHFKLIKARK